MSFNYQTQSVGSNSNGNIAFYPHSVSVLSPRQGEFQSFQQAQAGSPNTDSKSVIITRVQGDSSGTPLRQQDSSSVNLGQGTDFSMSSPYRVITTSNAEGVTSSPYNPNVAESRVGVSGGFKPMESSSGMQQASASNVIYSSQPLTSADFGGMMMGSNGSYFQPMASSGFSQMPMSMSGFSQMQMPMSSSGFSQMPMSSAFPAPSGYFSAASMTPRLLMNGSQGLTPRGFVSGVNLPTTTQIGLTPRSYQDQLSAVNCDPMMMMFAESFRNQCLAMSQYYASHPEESIESPKSGKVFVDLSPASLYSRADSRRRMQQPSLKTIHDQENLDTSNVTPSGVENHKKPALNDDIMDLLNQMTSGELEADEPAVPTSPPAKEGTRQFPTVTVQGPIVRAKPQSFWHKLGCGSSATSSSH